MTGSASSIVVSELATRPETAVGAFVEQPFHRHVEWREALLGRSEWLLEPDFLPRLQVDAEELAASTGEVRTALADAGLVKIGLNRPLTNEELVVFGRHIGTVMVHETSPRLREHVEDQLILNLRQEHEETPEYDIALVSRNYLSLHSEVCVKPLHKQPRYIVLMCIEPSEPDTGGQTVFVPMAAVHNGLAADQLELLSATNFRQFPHSPPIFSTRLGRPVFSFRDFGDDILFWRYVGPDDRVGVEEVNGALKSLLQGMYNPSLMFGIHWRRADLLVFDNWIFFHGRTFIRASAGARRHLKNLKIN